MHATLCVCPWIPTFDLNTKVVLVMHRVERAKTSATGPLALLCVPNSELRVHGVKDNPLDMTDLFVPERRVLLLYPEEGTRVLCRDFLAEDKRPITLIVPDGNWRQASTMKRRIKGLCCAETVRLPVGEKTRWGLRNEIRDDGLATFEAIARALGILESKSVQSGMEAIFDLMVKRVVESRGPRPDNCRCGHRESQDAAGQ
jgi:DTW domain-containing protein YfiP